MGHYFLDMQYRLAGPRHSRKINPIIKSTCTIKRMELILAGGGEANPRFCPPPEYRYADYLESSPIFSPTLIRIRPS